MKKTALILAAALLWVVPAGAEEVVRSFRQQVSVGNADKIHLDFPVGELQIDGWDDSKVDLDVKIVCQNPTSRCEEAAQKLRLVYDASGDTLEVRVKDWPRFGATKGLHVRGAIHVPRQLALNAELGVGELHIQGTANDTTVDLGVGEVHVTLPKAAFRTARIDTGIGEASLVAAGRRYTSEGLFTRTIHWDRGEGRAGVKVDCGVGEIHLNLE
jgi:hypothetical protein